MGIFLHLTGMGPKNIPLSQTCTTPPYDQEWWSSACQSFVKMSQVSQYISTQLAFGKAKKVKKVGLVQVGSDKERSKGWVGSGNARGRPGPK